MWKPDGYPSLSPYLITPRAGEVVAFLEAALDGQLLRAFRKESGEIVHAEVRIDDSVVMLGDAGEEFTPVPTHLHLYVPDVDAAYKRALEHGAESVQPPKQNEGEQDRRGGVRDVGGNTWWFGTQLG